MKHLSRAQNTKLTGGSDSGGDLLKLSDDTQLISPALQVTETTREKTQHTVDARLCGRAALSCPGLGFSIMIDLST